jgi:prevent-host-death family protein
MTRSQKSRSRARAGSQVTTKASRVLGNAKAAATAKAVATSALMQSSGKGKKIERSKVSQKRPPSVSRSHKASSWLLQDAKARFSELVRRVKAEGPQRVTVRGREEVVVISSEEFRRLHGGRTGAALIEAMQASPSREIELTPGRFAMPVRTVEL